MRSRRVLRKVTAAIIATTLSFSLAACRTRVDIQELAIIMAMGVDATDDGRYKVSYQVLIENVSNQGGGGGAGEAGGGAVGTIYFEGVGDTVIDAMYRMGDRISKKLFFGQLKILILGEKLSEKGISPVIDALGRFSEVRGNLPVYVTRGEAKAVVGQKSTEDQVPGDVMDEMVSRQLIVGTHPVKYLAQVMNRLYSSFSVPILGVINLPRILESPGESKFKLEGMAVFDEDKLIGFLDDKETLGYQFIKDNGDRATIQVKLSDGSRVVLGLIKSKSKIKAKIVEGKPQAVINVFQESSIREMTGEIDTIKDKDIMNEIARLQEEAVKKIIQETITAAKKDMEIDFIGIGEAIYRQHPKDFEKVRDAWRDKFLDADIKVYVNAVVKDTGLLSRPVP
jgi:spore germination protein KC